MLAFSPHVTISAKLLFIQSILREDQGADRALRGMQIGAKSMESEDGVVFADRFTAQYLCSNGHQFDVPFASEASLRLRGNVAAARWRN